MLTNHPSKEVHGKVGERSDHSVSPRGGGTAPASILSLPLSFPDFLERGKLL